MNTCHGPWRQHIVRCLREIFFPRANPRSAEHLILQPDRAPDRSESGHAELHPANRPPQGGRFVFASALFPPGSLILKSFWRDEEACFYSALCPVCELKCEASSASSSAMRARRINFKSATLCGLWPRSLSNLRRTARNESSSL